MQNVVTAHVRSVSQAAGARDADAVCRLLDFRSMAGDKLQRTLHNMYTQTPEGSFDRVIETIVTRGMGYGAGEEWGDVVSCWLKGMAHRARAASGEAFPYFEAAFKAFMVVFDTSVWMAVFKFLVKHIQIAAEEADAEGNKQADYNGRVIQFFRLTMVRMLGNAQQKHGTLVIVCGLFRIYLRLKNVQLCKDLLKTLRSRHLPPLHEFSISQQVEYNFFCGRLAMFDDDFETATQHLTDAFESCTRHHRRNKRLILSFLIPSRILIGSMPSDALLDKYDMPMFRELCKAIKAGNIAGFKRCLQAHRHSLINLGIYLTLEKVHAIVLRNLLRRTAEVLNTTFLRISHIQKALGVAGSEMEPIEIECVLATLISRRLVKGYISHEKQVLVLLKKGNPFPPISEVLGS